MPWTDGRRQRGHRNCGHAMPLRSILSLLYPPPSLAASAQLGVKWEKLSSERMPTNVRPFPPALAHVRDVWSLAGRGHCDGMVTPAMDAPQFQAHSISLPSSIPHRLSAIALFLLPSPSS